MGFAVDRRLLKAFTVTAGGYATTYGLLRWRRHWRGRPLVAFASSGAGSQVFPALAVASALREVDVGAVFLADSRGLEVHMVPLYGFVLHCVSSVELSRPLKSFANALNVLRFPLCVIHSAWVLARVAPDVVVGMGGSVSVPACAAAVALGIPLLLYEPNATAGPLTQALHKLAQCTMLACDSAAIGLRHRERCVVVGPSVRQEVLGSGTTESSLGSEERQRQRRKAREALGVTGRGARLLVVLGGSGGCGYLNCAVNNALPQLAALPGLHILWQTGAKQYVAYSAGHAASLPSVTCTPFIQDLGTALSAADLVLSRAGASTVAELLATGTPALLVPSPAVSEEQQTANARLLVNAGLAELLPQGDVDENGLAGRLLPLLAPDGKRLASMRARWSAAVGGAEEQSGAAAGVPQGGPPVGGAAVAAATTSPRFGICRPGRGSAVCIREEVMRHLTTRR